MDDNMKFWEERGIDEATSSIVRLMVEWINKLCLNAEIDDWDQRRMGEIIKNMLYLKCERPIITGSTVIDCLSGNADYDDMIVIRDSTKDDMNCNLIFKGTYKKLLEDRIELIYRPVVSMDSVFSREKCITRYKFSVLLPKQYDYYGHWSKTKIAKREDMP